MKVKSESISLSRVQLLVTPWTAAYQIPPSMGFSRQEYWSGVPLPSPSHSLVQGKNLVESTSGGSDGKESACNAEDLGSIPQSERYLGEEHGYPLQYSCLEYSHEQRILVGYISWGHKESDMTERLSTFIYVERF